MPVEGDERGREINNQSYKMKEKSLSKVNATEGSFLHLRGCRRSRDR
jgi:hypothetical protein